MEYSKFQSLATQTDSLFGFQEVNSNFSPHHSTWFLLDHSTLLFLSVPTHGFIDNMAILRVSHFKTVDCRLCLGRLTMGFPHPWQGLPRFWVSSYIINCHYFLGPLCVTAWGSSRVIYAVTQNASAKSYLSYRRWTRHNVFDLNNLINPYFKICIKLFNSGGHLNCQLL